MAWVAPSSRSLGDLITAAIWNQDVVTNPQALYDRSAPLSMCVCTDANNQTAAQAVKTAITFDTEVYDTDDYHSTVSNTSRFTAPVTGLYAVHARALANGSVGEPELKVDGGSFSPMVTSAEQNNADDVAIISAHVYLTATQYVEFCIDGAGADRTINPSFFSIVLLSGD